MLDQRKQKEAEYYDSHAQKWLRANSGNSFKGDFEGFVPLSLASYRFCYQQLAGNCSGKTVLDYGCGNGIHAIFLAKTGAEKVIGIDLSEKSLEIAKLVAYKEGVEDKVEFRQMDCEKMSFPDNSFDVVFDGGTFSSLDLDKSFSEIARVLRSDGVLIGIETLGHNPLTNLKRKLNQLVGKRTDWAVSHIFKLADIEKARQYFSETKVSFFHIISWAFFPLLRLPGARVVLKLLEGADEVLFRIKPLKRYAFKVVFIFSRPFKRQ